MNQKINVKFPTYFDCRGHERNLFECSHHRMSVNTGWYSNDECTQAEVRCKVLIKIKFCVFIFYGGLPGCKIISSGGFAGCWKEGSVYMGL